MGRISRFSFAPISVHCKWEYIKKNVCKLIKSFVLPLTDKMTNKIELKKGHNTGEYFFHLNLFGWRETGKFRIIKNS